MADANNKVDLKLNIKTAYDGAPMDAATAAIKAQELEQKRLAAEQAAAAAAAEREKAEQDALESVMRLTTMTVKQLKAEVRALSAARKEAAAVGDTESYKKLTAELGKAKDAMRQAKMAADLNRAAWAGQIQAAASLGATVETLTDQISNFNKNAKAGTIDVGGMTSAVMQLYGAFKTGMGPLALALYSFQMLQKTYRDWSHFIKNDGLSDKVIEERKKLQQEAADWVNEADEAGQQRRRAAAVKEFQEGQERGQKELAEEKRRADEAAAASYEKETEASRHRLALLRADMAAAKEADKARIEERIREEEKAQAKLAADRAEAEATSAEQYAEGLQKALSDSKYAPLLDIKLPDLERLDEVLANLNAARQGVIELTREERKGLQAEQHKLQAELLNISKLVKAANPAFEGTREEAVEWVAALQETRKAQKEAAENAIEAANAARRTADAAKQQATNKQEELDAEARAAAAAKEAAKVQEQRTKELRNILDGTRTTGNYVPEETRTQREILAADAELLHERERQLLAMQTRGGLTEEQEKQVADALTEVRRQTQGLADAQRRNAAEARKWLNELTPPSIKAQNKQAQSNADRYAKLWKRLADQAMRAAENGNDKQLDSLKKRLTQTAAAWGNVTRKSDQTDKLLRDTLDAVASSAKSDKRTADAKKKLADDTERAANAGTMQEGGKPAATPAQGSNVTGELQAQNAQLQQSVADLSAATGETVTALQNVSSSLAGLAAQVRGGLKEVRGRLTAAEGAIRDLQNGL